MDDIGEDAEVAVEEEEHNQGEYGHRCDLYDRANLRIETIRSEKV